MNLVVTCEMANLVKKNQNCQLKSKFGTLTNSNMQNSMVVSLFRFLTGISPFGQTGSKNSKESAETEI